MWQSQERFILGSFSSPSLLPTAFFLSSSSSSPSPPPPSSLLSRARSHTFATSHLILSISSCIYQRTAYCQQTQIVILSSAWTRCLSRPRRLFPVQRNTVLALGEDNDTLWRPRAALPSGAQLYLVQPLLPSGLFVSRCTRKFLHEILIYSVTATKARLFRPHRSFRRRYLRSCGH